MEPDLNVNNQLLLKSKVMTISSQKNHPLIPESARDFQTEDVIEVKAATWTQPHFELFDYENHDYEMQRFQFKASAQFALVDGEVQKMDIDKPLDSPPLIVVERRGNDFFLRAQLPERSDTELEAPERYLVVRSLVDWTTNKAKGYVLRTGDVIKFGEVKYKVSETRNKRRGDSEFEITKCEQFVSQNNQHFRDKLFDVTEQTEELNKLREQQRASRADPDSAEELEDELVCRYCLVESICEDPVDNLLVHPCNCSGGSGYVHVHCLRSWIQQKIVSKNTPQLVTYKWDNLKCEVCKSKWPVVIKYRDTCRRLFNVDKPASAYTIFERVSENKDMANENAMTMVLENGGATLKLGKAMNNPFRLSDPSVSNLHATVQYRGGEFVLEDKNSQFGTLAMLRTDWKVGYNKIAVQVGRTVFTLMKKEVKVK